MRSRVMKFYICDCEILSGEKMSYEVVPAKNFIKN